MTSMLDTPAVVTSVYFLARFFERFTPGTFI